MKDILKEKFKKYDTTWKTIKIHNLKDKLKQQLNSMSIIFNPIRAKRQILHIANYCYFIWYQLNNNKYATDYWIRIMKLQLIKQLKSN